MTAPLEHWLPVMNTDARQSIELARAAEAAGFTGIALADHVALPVDFQSVHPSGGRPFEPDGEFTDPFATAGAMLAVTSRLKVMTYVYIVTMRDPWSVAKGAGTLSMLSNGRFGLGVGAGWLLEEIALLGYDPTTRGKRMDADLATIRELLQTGRTKAASGGEIAMEPIPPIEPPIWVGGKSVSALRRAAHYDGWLGMNYPMDETLALLDRLAELRAEHNSAPGGMTLAMPMVAPTPGVHEELAGRGATATLGIPWAPGDPAFADLDTKRAALGAWSERFGLA